MLSGTLARRVPQQHRERFDANARFRRNFNANVGNPAWHAPNVDAGPGQPRIRAWHIHIDLGLIFKLAVMVVILSQDGYDSPARLGILIGVAVLIYLFQVNKQTRSLRSLFIIGPPFVRRLERSVRFKNGRKGFFARSRASAGLQPQSGQALRPSRSWRLRCARSSCSSSASSPPCSPAGKCLTSPLGRPLPRRSSRLQCRKQRTTTKIRTYSRTCLRKQLARFQCQGYLF